MEEKRLSDSIKLVMQHYWQQLLANKVMASLGLFLPGIGNILIFYVPPLIVAGLLARFSEPGADLTLQAALPYVAAFGLVWLAGEIIWRIALQALIILETKSIERLYNQAMQYLLEKDLGFFNDNFTGSITKKTIGYAKNFVGTIDTLSFGVFSNILPLIFIIIVLWQFSPWLVATLLGLVSIAIACMAPLIKRRQKLVAARETSSNVLSGHIADTISNMPAVHAFAREDQELAIHRSNTRDFAIKSKASWDYQNLRIDMVAAPFYVITNVAGLCIALTLGGTQGISIEAIFISFSYFASFTKVLWEFNRIYRNLETNVNDAAQFTEMLLEKPRIVDPDHPEKLAVKGGAVVFKDVTFSYPDSAKHDTLFKDFNLQLKPGERVGLVGHSGGGKTTVTKLLLRFMDIKEGAILIDGQDIRSISLEDLRSHIAYVPQDSLLFHRSLYDNIAYGRPGASKAEVLDAAKKAHALEFIEKLPKGFETLVGERGVKLSGGQRQRISIARAILKNAPILVLDEATSALDSESEQLIQTALTELMKDRTSIVIAHRLSTVQKMDRIVVLENGATIEDGSHKDLIAHGGIYASLWKHQSGGFIEE